MADGEEVEVKNDAGSNGAGMDAADNRADGNEKGDGEDASLTMGKSAQIDGIVTEDANTDVAKEGAGAGAGVDEGLSEQMECDKGSDDHAVEGDLGGMISLASGDDAVNHDEKSGEGVGSEHVDGVDQVKESTLGEADLDEQGVAVETRQIDEMKTDGAEHKDEYLDKNEVEKKSEKEEDADQKMDIIETKEVEAKENMIVAGGFRENGSRKSSVYDFNSLDGNDSGDEEEQSAFIQELDNFFKARNLEFKPPKFYQEDLNCLKLWRAVIREGGYDQVTTSKLWRHVGETFNPPKTCTTVSWSFRGFYEKALVDYERYLVESGELQLSPNPRSLPSGSENQKAGSSQPGSSGRAKRDAAARAMQGWHSQRQVSNEEEKSSGPLSKREKQLKTINEGKRKRHSSDEQAVKAARTKLEGPRSGQPATPVSMKEVSIKDIGPAAEWVKINVRKNAECWEIYALVPGLLREEVRVQSDPAGRLVISGEPEQADNPWGVTPFKKVITLPSRINPHQTTAVVTLHGQLFVRSPFEQQTS